MLARLALSVACVAGMLLSSAARADNDAGNPKLIPNDMSQCGPASKGPAILVRIFGFKDRAGNVRVQTYSDKQEELLEKGKYFNRIVQALGPSGDVMVCMPVPKPGKYVLFVHHDRNANNGLGTSDGAAFSNNPPLKFGIPKPPKPNAKESAIDASSGIVKTDIRMNYLSGFSIKPVETPVK
jgi:uncharacterized protein (DUF2141 family)